MNQLILMVPFPITGWNYLIGPLLEIPRGNKYIVTLVDYFSKWPEVEALPDKTAKGVAPFLYKMMSREYIYHQCFTGLCTL